MHAFFYVFLFNTVEPENLCEILLLCLVLRLERRSVIAACLCGARAALDGSDIFVLNGDFYGVETCGVIRSDR